MESENLIAGRNAVRELLKSGKPIDKLYILKGTRDGLLSVIFAEATRAGIPVAERDRAALDRMAVANQGVIAQIPERAYASLDDIIALAKERNEAPFVVIADCINDPHNLGAIIRSAECAGCHGVIIPKRHSALLTPAAVKASAGAVEHIPVCKVSNLSMAIEFLKENGLWIYALEADGVPYDGLDYKGGCALVLGSEGEGVSRLVRENSDFVVSIPMRGKVNSLNVSNAAAVVLFEVAKGRR
ncbi:MAG: 23S rRNA (guanosine(2251)-2'-O)-methyltransferase RlmB [Clostridia bacterium]|nr:23S rRNA (guanosine(2251)-2'-O)-methyltransferase RlmB [Clostridia bacterium]MBQ7048345.1 23S rRNA (guanosine(2251)-2'-O)-methyltransferase RlmB [Clostridia bacterium]